MMTVFYFFFILEIWANMEHKETWVGEYGQGQGNHCKPNGFAIGGLLNFESCLQE